MVCKTIFARICSLKSYLVLATKIATSGINAKVFVIITSLQYQEIKIQHLFLSVRLGLTKLLT